MKKKRAYQSLLFGALGLAFLIFVWWLVSDALYRSGNRLLPGPGEVFPNLPDKLFGIGAATTYAAVGWTFLRIIIGFVISFVLGAILGTLAGLFHFLKNFMAPFVLLAKSLPTAAVVLVLVGVLYSYKGLPPFIPCFLVFLVAFPLIYEAFRSGIENENEETRDALRLDAGERSFKGVLAVYWPDSSPFIFLSLAQSLGLAVKVSIMSEILTNSSGQQSGIGNLIQIAKSVDFSMNDVITYSLVAVILVMVFDIPLAVIKRKSKNNEGK